MSKVCVAGTRALSKSRRSRRRIGPSRTRSLRGVTPRHLDAFFDTEALVLDAGLVLLVEQVERQRFPALDRRVEIHRDRDEPETDCTLPDRSRHGSQSPCRPGASDRALGLNPILTITFVGREH